MINLGNDKCFGCTACGHICPKNAISFHKSNDGFIVPLINTKKCIECHLCEKNCPYICGNKSNNVSSSFISAKRKNIKKRLQSQSGGAFSVFAESILKKKGIVYGVEFSNRNAHYTRIDSKKYLNALKGSKYVQAIVGDIYPLVAKDLQGNKLVLFSGTPCHVDGLYHFLEQKCVRTDNLITIDIICHGVVSPKIFDEYISYIEHLHNKRIKWFNFRDKSFGWHSHFVTYKIGRDVFKSKEYVKIFYSNYVLRKACFECHYSNFKRVSDITIGDSWGVNNFYPEFDDNKGCSLIMPNTKKGSELFQLNKDKFDIIQLDKEMAIQPNLVHPTAKPVFYNEFWNDYSKYGFEYAVYKYCEFDPNRETIVLKKHQIFRRIKHKIMRVFGS